MWLTLCRLTRGLTVGVTSRQLESLRRRDLWEPGDPAPLWDAVLCRDEDRGGGTGDEATTGGSCGMSPNGVGHGYFHVPLFAHCIPAGWGGGMLQSPRCIA